jgi:DNA-directed RNA polymerase I subunit RPA1
MMCHRVRVLEGQKTIRMHYSNCTTYNADYDGDEMNLHFLQSEGPRSEGSTLMFADNHYFSSSTGEPLRGLIQDNVCGGILLTKKDTFLSHDMYMHLVFSACYVLEGTVRGGGVSYEALGPQFELFM